MGDWIMYYEIQRLLREGYKISQIANYIVADCRTVKKYADMAIAEYEEFLLKKTTRAKALSSYEEFVKDRLLACPGASSAQVLDWLKEHHSDFPPVYRTCFVPMTLMNTKAIGIFIPGKTGYASVTLWPISGTTVQQTHI